jgi:hypothetical protein
MRVLWVDSDDNPWIEPGGWQVLEDFGLQVERVGSTAQADPLLKSGGFDLLLVRTEVSGAVPFLAGAKKALGPGRKIVVTSSTWTKEQFKNHSKTEGAADRYARVPMPPEGFLSLVAALFNCTVEDFPKFGSAPPLPKPPARKRAAPPSAEDGEVLHKYLRIKEEQLEIAEGERKELSLENERIQRDAHQLQVRLRELEHLHDELEQKLQHMEEEKAAFVREQERAEEERERLEETAREKIRSLESALGEANEKYENLRVRVRKDIRKIRENERDLEARLELLRKDSATLLQARDEKVLEMQRKIDALEFDLDQVQDGRVQAQMEAESYLAKLSRVSRALRVASGMLEEEQETNDELEELEPLLGGAAEAQEPKIEEAPEPGAAGLGGEAMAGAEAPPAEGLAEGEAEAADLSDELAALANDGEPTQMISAEALSGLGEPDSSSG